MAVSFLSMVFMMSRQSPLGRIELKRITQPRRCSLSVPPLLPRELAVSFAEVLPQEVLPFEVLWLMARIPRHVLVPLVPEPSGNPRIAVMVGYVLVVPDGANPDQAVGEDESREDEHFPHV